MYDIVIIGCGPAGMTAAIYAARSNKKVLIIEKETIGGQMASSPLIENYPGFTSISGSELASNMFDQVMNLNVNFELEEVKEIVDGTVKKVITDSNTYETKTIIIATGSKYRLLGLENENYQENKSLMQKLDNYLNENYEGLSRGIYEKQGVGVNGVYNQDFSPNTILIEFGGVDNTILEVANSVKVVAEALYNVINEDKTTKLE